MFHMKNERVISNFHELFDQGSEVLFVIIFDKTCAGQILTQQCFLLPSNFVKITDQVLTYEIVKGQNL